jgi:hypothetical protein
LNPSRMKIYGLGKKDRRAVNAGKVSGVKVEEALKALREQEWSSFPVYAGIRKAPEWLRLQEVRERMQGKLGKPYRERLEQKIRLGLKEDVWEELKAGFILGSKAFALKIGELMAINREEQFKTKELKKRLTWREVVKGIEEEKGESWSEFSNRHGDTGRDLVLWMARRHGGDRLKELGELAGGMSYQSVHKAILNFERKRKASEMTLIKKLFKKLNLQIRP